MINLTLEIAILQVYSAPYAEIILNSIKMKTLVFLVAFLFLSLSNSYSNAPNINVLQNIRFTFTSVKQQQPNYAIVYQLSSPPQVMGDCTYWVTLTVSYVFDDDNNYLGPVVSSPTLNHDCGYSGPYYTRPISLSITTDISDLVDSVSFGLTGDAACDDYLSSLQTAKDLEKLINDNIPRP